MTVRHEGSAAAPQPQLNQPVSHAADITRAADTIRDTADGCLCCTGASVNWLHHSNTAVADQPAATGWYATSGLCAVEGLRLPVLLPGYS
jgi:hypothetical protein